MTSLVPENNNLTNRQELVTALAKASAHLPISRTAMEDIAKYAMGVQGDTRTALLGLLSQPDPHGHLSAILPKLICKDWFGDDRVTKVWIKDADLCFHAVNAIHMAVLGKAATTPDSTLYLPLRIVKGLQRIRSYNPNYTPLQLRDFARIAMAAYGVMLTSENLIFSQNPHYAPAPLITGSKTEHNVSAEYLNSKVFLDLASNHAAAEEIIRTIITNRVYMKDTILYCLHGKHAALLS